MIKRLAPALLLTMGVAQAQPFQQQISKCMAINGMLQRLACFDAAARDAGLSPSHSDAVTAAPVYSEPTPAAAPKKPSLIATFGSETLPETAPDVPAHINAFTAQITQFQIDPLGKFTMTLANGQVWKEVDTILLHVETNKPHIAHMSRGVLGSYNVSFDGEKQIIKVQRVR